MNPLSSRLAIDTTISVSRSFRRSLHRLFAILVWLFLVGASFPAVSQDFLTLDRFYLDGVGRAVLVVPVSPDSYYILYRGDDLQTVQAPAALAAGPSSVDPQPVELTDDIALVLSSTRFYRVERVPITAPKDSDGDGLDDVYELTRRRLLDALNASDATQDPDGDRQLTVDEYRAGTDPFRYNGPPAPHLTTDPDATMATLIPLRGTAAVGTYIRVEGGATVATNDVGSDGTFSVLVRLATNRVNRLFVSSVDSKGVASVGRPLEVLQDSQPPTLFLDFPTNASRLTVDKTIIAGRVGDLLSGYRGLRVWVHSSPAEGDSPLATTQFPTNSPLNANVDVGIGPNGTYQRANVPLVVGTNVITVVAADLLGNPTTRRAEIVRISLAGPRLIAVSGDRQTTNVLRRIPEPLVVRAQLADGTPMVGI
ncbi:MAG TPA: hypothetical protein PLX89_27020, partial [Verrucomicrobiota bacterium]|nr:hypothetical protein [Verrucomicrobiota bacterium]